MDAKEKEYIVKTAEAMERKGFGKVILVFKDYKLYDIQELKITRANEIR